jgi:hypothetical protein
MRTQIQGFDDQKLEKNTAEKINILLIKNYIYLAPTLHKEHPSYRRNIQLSKEQNPALQKHEIS